MKLTNEELATLYSVVLTTTMLHDQSEITFEKFFVYMKGIKADLNRFEKMVEERIINENSK